LALLIREPIIPIAAFADRLLLHPVRTVVLSFAVGSLSGASMLALPLATASGDATPFVDALFTAVSALCVTGLATLDTGTHWSGFGLGVILFLIQLGGLGLMLVATLLGSLLWSRLSIAQQRRTSAEMSALHLTGDLRAAVRLIVKVALIAELLLASILALRFWHGHALAPVNALWHGVFHAISAYNNAGFGLRPDSLVAFASDPLILVPIALAIIVGGVGFPVLWDIRQQRWRRSRWSLHTRVTVAGTALLLLLGFIGTILFEWHGALGSMDIGDRFLNAAFFSVSLRTAGFNSFAMDSLTNPTLVMASALMFIGAGVASTGGGIKVATIMVLALVVRSELRGDRDVSAFGRRISGAAQRRATAVVLVGMMLVVAAALGLSLLTALPMRDVAFEAVSAFATVGLSTGITASLPDAGKGILIMLMFAGRVGPVTLGAALIIRYRQQSYRYPQEDPIIG
jgi:trk system potassium uptake protein TrkH